MSIPKTCDQYRELMLSLGAAAFGVSRRADLQEMLTHLDNCPDCRRAAAEFEELRDTLSAGAEKTATAEPAGGWQAFEARMEAAITVEDSSPKSTAGRIGPGQRWFTWRVAAALVLATGIGAAAGLRFAPQRPVAPVGAGRSVDVSMTRLSAPELKQNVEAFDNIASVFDRRASWIMLADGRQSDVGLVPGPVDANASPLVIRMVVRRADGPDTAAARWAVVSQCDLVIVPGQNAELTVKSLDSRRLNFHVQTDAQSLHRVTLMLELGDIGESAAAADRPRQGTALMENAREQPRGMLATSVLLDYGNAATVGQIVTTGGIYSLAVGLDAMPPPTSREKESL